MAGTGFPEAIHVLLPRSTANAKYGHVAEYPDLSAALVETLRDGFRLRARTPPCSLPGYATNGVAGFPWPRPGTCVRHGAAALQRPRRGEGAWILCKVPQRVPRGGHPAAILRGVRAPLLTANLVPAQPRCDRRAAHEMRLAPDGRSQGVRFHQRSMAVQSAQHAHAPPLRRLGPMSGMPVGTDCQA